VRSKKQKKERDERTDFDINMQKLRKIYIVTDLLVTALSYVY